jgi:hypothetical protein
VRRRGPSPARALALLLVVGLLSAGYLALRALQVRDGLLGARAQLAALTAGEVGPVDDARLREVQAQVASARSATEDPLWRLAAAVPVAGAVFAAGADAAEATDLVARRVLPASQRVLAAVEDRAVLTEGRVDLAVLQAVRPDVEAAADAARSARALAERAGSGRLPARVAALSTELQEQTRRLDHGLGAASTALGLAPRMLGADGPRRYMVVVMNNAETRAAGGLPGAFVVVRVDRGELVREAVGTNNDFRDAPEPVVDLGEDFARLYDPLRARRAWSATVTPAHWPSSSQVVAALWERQGGGRLDGVVGVDPVVLAELLGVTGEITVGSRTLSQRTIADFIWRGEYEEFRDEPDSVRQDVLRDIARAVYDSVARAGYPPLELGRALVRSAASGHLQVWSADAEEQAVLEASPVGGALPSAPGAFLHVTMNNAAGNKADVYLRRRVEYGRNGGRGTLRVTLTNTVDPSAVAPIVTGRLDEPAGELEPGTTRQLVTVYAGAGQLVEDLRVDGQRVPFETGTEQEHGIARTYVEIAPSRPTVVEAVLTDPGGTLVYARQPLAVEDELALDVPHRVR